MSHISPIYNASHAIRQEIQRFESVHPSIYAIYDLIESIQDKDLQDKIHNYVVCIEDAFVNSQEWTLNRGIQELRLGVLGTPQSGKSALVHRYLTGSYMLDDSPEGGRFKKEVSIPEVGNCLLLIRDEGGPPDAQFAAWCDACLFVFALDCADSLDVVYQYYGRVAQWRSLTDLPVLLVGTQDTISESRPRVIDEVRSLKAAHDLRRCPYFETCATYGHNVDRVFHEACHRIVGARCQAPGLAAAHQQQQQHRAPLGAYNLPQGLGHPAGREHQVLVPGQYYEQQQPVGLKSSSSNTSSCAGQWDRQAGDVGQNQNATYYCSASVAAVSTASQQQQQQQQPLVMRSSRDRTSYAQGVSFAGSEQQPQQQQQQSSSGATPTQGRKSRRRSNLFSRKEEQPQQQQQPPQQHSVAAAVTAAPTPTVGSGRAIPAKQGYLYKRSSGRALSRRSDWKRKYAALSEDGLLTYYASMEDYMANCRGKSIDLSRITVKVPGQTRPTSNGLLLKTQLSQQPTSSSQQQQQPPHRRAKSSNRNGTADPAKTPDEDSSIGSSTSAAPSPGGESCFTIVSLDNRTWLFDPLKLVERDDWVRSIEQGIQRRLQQLGRDGHPSKTGAAGAAANVSPLSSSSGTGGVNAASAAAAAAVSASSGSASVHQLRDLPGNDVCADCSRPDPEWASLNLGVLLCIECSGIHRDLGTHLSRVRSLYLDVWPDNNVLVMRSIGNQIANSVWEARLDIAGSSATKPGPDAAHELKKKFVRAKYERREFLPELPYPDCPVQQQLVDAIARSDTAQVILCLAVAGAAVNLAYSQQDSRAAVHIAATLGQLPYLQLLLWYGADPAVRDADGRTGHFYAAAAGHPACAEFLLAAGCPSAFSSSRRRSSRTGSPASPPIAAVAAAAAEEIEL